MVGIKSAICQMYGFRFQLDYLLDMIFFKNNDFYLFIFSCAESCCFAGFFSRCGEQGLLSSCDARVSHCGGFSCCGAWALGRAGFSSRRTCELWGAGSEVVGHRLSSSAACGVVLNQGSNPCLLYWQVDSLPLSYQGSLLYVILSKFS